MVTGVENHSTPYCTVKICFTIYVCIYIYTHILLYIYIRTPTWKILIVVLIEKNRM